MLGGGSSINGQMANRGAPTDYDEWEARGAAGWNWNDVLPYFKKVERDLDFDGPLHGKDGRIPVRRIPQERWTRHSQAAGRGLQARRLHVPAGPERRVRRRLFPGHASPIEDEQRVSAAIGYLDRETRKRANLTISTDTQVKELLFEGTRCVGVKALVDGREQEFRGREIILSCGAIHSPAHPAARRHRPGRAPQGDGHPGRCWALPGVGQRLMDHPSIALSSFIRRGARMNGAHPRGTSCWGCAIRRGCRARRRATCSSPCSSKSAWHAVGEQIASLLTFVNKTYSETGQVQARLARPARRADRRVQPAVRPARPRPADERLPQDGGDADERAAARRSPTSPSRRPTPTACARSAWSTTRTGRSPAIAATLMDGPAALRH